MERNAASSGATASRPRHPSECRCLGRIQNRPGHLLGVSCHSTRAIDSTILDSAGAEFRPYRKSTGHNSELFAEVHCHNRMESAGAAEHNA